jgi:hypothetical protein
MVLVGLSVTASIHKAAIVRKTLPIVLTLFILRLISCSPSKDEQKVETDIKLLSRIINLDSLSPSAVKWAIDYPGDNPGRLELGPTDYSVVAVITLPPGDFEKLREKYTSFEDVHDRIHLEKDFVIDWFSESVKECFQDEGTAVGVTVPAYNPITFFKSPLLNGTCFFTKGNEVFLFLYTT